MDIGIASDGLARFLVLAAALDAFAIHIAISEAVRGMAADSALELL